MTQQARNYLHESLVRRTRERQQSYFRQFAIALFLSGLSLGFLICYVAILTKWLPV
jgi:hypothetical protein